MKPRRPVALDRVSFRLPVFLRPSRPAPAHDPQTRCPRPSPSGLRPSNPVPGIRGGRVNAMFRLTHGDP